MIFLNYLNFMIIPFTVLSMISSSDRKLAEKKLYQAICQGYSISIQLNNEDCQSIKRLTRTSHFFTVICLSPEDEF